MTPTPHGQVPDSIRVPLDSLHADAEYLLARLLAGTLTREQVVGVIRDRIDAARLEIESLKAQIAAALPGQQDYPESPMKKVAQALREKAEAERGAFDRRIQSGEWGSEPDTEADSWVLPAPVSDVWTTFRGERCLTPAGDDYYTSVQVRAAYEAGQAVAAPQAAPAAVAGPVMTRHRTKDDILHFLTKEQMVEEIIRLDAALAAAPTTQPSPVAQGDGGLTEQTFCDLQVASDALRAIAERKRQSVDVIESVNDIRQASRIANAAAERIDRALLALKPNFDAALATLSQQPSAHHGIKGGQHGTDN